MRRNCCFRSKKTKLHLKSCCWLKFRFQTLEEREFPALRFCHWMRPCVNGDSLWSEVNCVFSELSYKKIIRAFFFMLLCYCSASQGSWFSWFLSFVRASQSAEIGSKSDRCQSRKKHGFSNKNHLNGRRNQCNPKLSRIRIRRRRRCVTDRSQNQQYTKWVFLIHSSSKTQKSEEYPLDCTLKVHLRFT